MFFLLVLLLSLFQIISSSEQKKTGSRSSLLLYREVDSESKSDLFDHDNELIEKFTLSHDSHNIFLREFIQERANRNSDLQLLNDTICRMKTDYLSRYCLISESIRGKNSFWPCLFYVFAVQVLGSWAIDLDNSGMASKASSLKLAVIESYDKDMIKSILSAILRHPWPDLK